MGFKYFKNTKQNKKSRRNMKISKNKKNTRRNMKPIQNKKNTKRNIIRSQNKKNSRRNMIRSKNKKNIAGMNHEILAQHSEINKGSDKSTPRRGRPAAHSRAHSRAHYRHMKRLADHQAILNNIRFSKKYKVF